MKTKIAAVLLAAGATLAAAQAQAASFSYRFGFLNQGSTVAVAGTLSATEVAAGEYRIDGATGTIFEEYTSNGTLQTYTYGQVAGVAPTFSDAGPGFTLANGAIGTFNAIFRGDNPFGGSFAYEVEISPTWRGGFLTEIGGPLTEAVLTPAAPGGVPEPATWALMILGFGAVGAAMRRRARVAVRYA